MPIIVYCKACAKKIRVPEGPSGRFGKCPACGEKVAIPEESEAAPPKIGHDAPAPAQAPSREDAPTPREAHEPVVSSAESDAPPTPREPQEPVPASPTPSPPAAGPRAPTGKPARIALDLSKLESARLVTPDLEPAGAGEALGQVRWDTRPDAAPSRWPLALLLLAALAVAALLAWPFLRSEDAGPKSTPEERRRQQFQLEENPKDELHLLQEKMKKKEGGARK